MEVESDMEDMIDDIENENNLEEESRTEVKVENDIKLDEQSSQQEIYDIECKSCSFVARTKVGLTVHMKSDHIVPCKNCNYKTTTIALLNKHKKMLHK